MDGVNVDKDIITLYWKHINALAHLKMYDRIDRFILSVQDGDLDMIVMMLMGSKPLHDKLLGRQVLLEDSRISQELRNVL